MRIIATFATLWLSLVVSAAAADIRILHYDSNGRVASTDQQGFAEDGTVVPNGPAAANPAARFEPGEILIVNAGSDLQRQLSDLGYQVIETARLRTLSMQLLRLRVPKGTSVIDAIATVRRLAPNALVDANHLFEAAGAQAASQDSWVRAVIGWPSVAGDCGAGLRIGMIDSAVDISHPALAGQRIDYRNYLDPSRRIPQADHGTAVAAILIGRPSAEGWGGILPGATLKAANMFEVSDSGRLQGNVMALLRALDWLAAEQVHVVNMSMAGADNKALRYALAKAKEKGLVLVAAAGNWGSAERPAFPAAYEEVIAVTAFGRNGRAYAQANRGSYIDFAAPGVELWTAAPEGGRYQSGTSFAAPYVSAHVAIEAARGVSNSASLRATLSRRATDLGAPGRDEVFGWGFVQTPPTCRL